MGKAQASISSKNVVNVDIYRDLIRPTPKQVDFLIAAHQKKFTLYGGAVGGGKSYILRWFLIDFLIRMRKVGLKNVEVGLFCETFPDLQDRHIDKSRAEFPPWLGRWRKYDFILNENAGIVKFRNLDDPSKYLSAEFAAIAVDELTRNPKSVFDALRLRLRWPGVAHLPFVAGTNPGGVGHQWVLQCWLNNQIPDDLAAEYTDDDFGFVQALPRDNPHLTSEYFASLNSLPEMMKRAYLEGDWTVFAGMFFPMFKRRIHLEKPFVIPPEWPLTASLDPGWASPACFSVYATDFDGVIHNVATYYAANKSTPQHAHDIHRFLAVDIKPWTGGRMPYLITAGHDAWSRKDRHAIIANEATAADIFQTNEGLTLTKAVTDRIPGWWRVRDALEHERIKFFDNGTNEPVIQQLESILADEKDPEDIQGKGNDKQVEDHALDTLRYMLMTIYRPEEREERKEWQRPQDFAGGRNGARFGRKRRRAGLHQYSRRPWVAS